jgi:pimeloyl-ACP methyl ester carboxylesterase
MAKEPAKKATAAAATTDAAKAAASKGSKSSGGKVVEGALKTALGIGIGVGAAAIANAVIFYRTPPLTSKLPGGEVRYFPTPEGDVFYKKAGDGPPLLLVHGIGAGCSSYEFKDVFAALAEKYTVYALDLLGFGKSDKPALSYKADTYLDLIDDFCRQVMRVGDGRGEADVIATSLSAAYVIQLAQRDPSLFRRLVLVCPTGIEELASQPNAGSTAIRGVFKSPVLGTSLYNAIASKSGIRSYLRSRVYADPAKVTDEVVEQFYVAAHQPGGDSVLPSFVSGYLNLNIADAWKGVVDLPLIVWGRQAVETPIAQAEAFLTANPNAKLEVIEDAGLLPHAEQPAAFLAAVRPFLAAADPAPAEEDAELAGV